MADTCAVHWCVWLTVGDATYCKQHTERPALHDREAPADYGRRLRSEDTQKRKRARAAQLELWKAEKRAKERRI